MTALFVLYLYIFMILLYYFIFSMFGLEENGRKMKKIEARLSFD